MFKVSCEDLGVIDCNYVARGEIPGDVFTEMVDHLKTTHDMDMPEAEEILKNHENHDGSVLVLPGLWVNESPMMDESVRLVTERLVNKLNLPKDS
jgi:predicted small metal-binding protein